MKANALLRGVLEDDEKEAAEGEIDSQLL